MDHFTLEEHLENICPKCGKEHDSKWEFEFYEMKSYMKLTCETCNYKVFKKTEYMTSGHVEL